MTSVARNALAGAIAAAALIAVLIGPASAQGGEEQQRAEAAKKARELEAQEKAYKSATDLIPAKQVPLDPWGNVRANAPPPPKAPR